MQWYYVTLLCLSWNCWKRGVQPFDAQNFIYQKDMSEYCQRRVIPSVFLGRHVTEANSRILHFSQLEVPYSCTISIRAEPGSNIVLVLEMKNVTEACGPSADDDSQVLVYEMGETFGGYWGQLPAQILNLTASTHAHYYTLRHTSPSSSDSEYESMFDIHEDRDSKVELKEKDTIGGRNRPSPDNDFLSIEVPLVNVSGVVVDSNNDVRHREKVFEVDEQFDAINDLAPKPGDEFFGSSILPLLQYSIVREDNRRLGDTAGIASDETAADDGQTDGDDAGSTAPDGPRYALDYEVFTPDPRFKYPFLERIMHGKENNFHKEHKFKSNKMLKFRKENGPFIRKQNHPTTIYFGSTANNISNNNIRNVLESTTTGEESKLNELIEALNRGNTKNLSDFKNTNMSKLMENISNMHHNISVYLSPDLSIYNTMRQSSKTEQIDWRWISKPTMITKLTHTTQATSTRIKEKQHVGSKLNITRKHNPSSTIQTTVKSIEISSTQKHLESTTISIHTTPTDIMMSSYIRSSYGHYNTRELENPSIKIQTTVKSITKTSTQKHSKSTTISTHTTPTDVMADSSKTATTKHHIQSQEPVMGTKIPNGPFPPAKPIHMLDHESIENIVLAAPKLADILNISYPGGDPARETIHRKTRRKRFIQAIDIEAARPHIVTWPEINITPKPKFFINDRQDFAQLVELQDDEANRMTMVVTPARIMPPQESRCPDQHLECQVSGARVCIDALCACDGVPNCGSYDVYDEDRLRCSKQQGGQQSVYLAALAFLAVLFTALYTVHYWLGRCVPKVSDAFFVYTDGTENILYLDTIMRSPITDQNDPYCNSNIFAREMMEDMQSDTKELSKIEKFKNLFPCFRKTIEDIAIKLETLDNINPDLLSASQRRRDIFSFAEEEIFKFGRVMTDEITQTGDSLEMPVADDTTAKKKRESVIKGVRQHRRSSDTRIKSHLPIAKDEQQSKNSELSMLKFMREATAKRPGQQQGPVVPKVPQPAPASRLRQMSESVPVSNKEREIQSTFYDSKTNLHVDSLSSCIPEDSSFIKPGTSGQARKHLRFNDNLLATITSDDEYVGKERKRQSAYLGPAKPAEDEKDENVQEHSAARDFKRFWSSNKGNKKPAKKRNQSSLR